MGGKHKQAQRTKDNAKPSSSGRSAALLNSTTSTFVGFSGVKDCGYVPILPSFPVTHTDDIDSTIDTNFQLVLKKMNKKDSTTRLKALQEFAKLVESSALDAVKAVLPFWPRLYSLLAEDMEHRVREAAHVAHRTMVLRAKRNVAPHLRQLAGPWFTAQFDTYAPAASAATKAFHDTFPGKKLVEAIVFCQEDILNYICDNVLSQVVQSTTSSKNVSVEKLRAKQQRTVVSCLQGYAHLLHFVPVEHLPTLQSLPTNQRMIGATHFWELANDNSSQVRSAWLAALVAIFVKSPQLLTDCGPQVARAILYRLDEEDASVLPHVWEAALHVLTTVKDCWTEPEADQVVLPSLWRVLSEAGYGNASAIFPGLLPLLSRLPQAQGSGRETFCDQFFSRMRQGFGQKCVVQSPGECEAVASCYIECLRYVISTSVENQPFTCQLLKEHLLSALELVLTDPHLRLLSGPLFEHSTMLACHWSLHPELPVHTVLLEHFWTALADVYMRLLSPLPSNSSPNTYQQQVDLCLCLKTPGRRKRKRSQKVRFHDTGTESVVTLPVKKNKVAGGSSDTGPEFHCRLEQLVMQVCVSYLTKMRQSHCLNYVVPLSHLVSSFNSHKLFTELSGSCNLAELFDGSLCVWVPGEEASVGAAVELAFDLLQHLPDCDKQHMLDIMCQDTSNPMLMWALPAARARHHDPYFEQWLLGPQFSHILVSLVPNIYNEPDSNTAKFAKSMLKDCLAKTGDGAIAVSSEALSAVLSELCSGLESCASFAAELLVQLCVGGLELCQTQSAGTLVLAMFASSCSHRTDGVWRQSMVALASTLAEDTESLRRLVTRFMDPIKNELLKREVVAIDDIEHLAKMSAILVDSATNGDSSLSLQLCDAFLDSIHPELDARELQLVAACMDAEELTGSLCGSEYKGKHCTAVTLEVTQYVVLALFCTRLLVRVLTRTSTDEELDATEEKITEDLDVLFNTWSEQVDVSDDIPLSTANQANASVTNVNKLDAQSVTSDDKSALLDKPLVENIDESLDATDEAPFDQAAEIVTFTSDNPSEVSESVPDEFHQFASDTEIVPSEEAVLEPVNVQTLECDILNTACAVALCQIFQKHYKSTSHYSKVSSHLDLLQHSFKTLLTSLGPAGQAHMNRASSCRAAQDGGVWVWVRYMLSVFSRAESDIGAVYEEMKETVGARHAAQVLVSLMGLKMCPVTDVVLTGSTCLTTWACWLENSFPLPVSISADTAVALLSKWPGIGKDELIYSCDVSLEPWSRVTQVSEMIHLLTACIATSPDRLTQRLWDFTLVSAAYYAESLQCSQGCLEVHSAAHFTIAVCRLIAGLANLFTQVNHEKGKDKEFLKVLSIDWSAVFSDDVHRALLKTFFTLAENMERKKVSLQAHSVLESLGAALISLNTEFFTRQDDPSRQKLLELCCQLIHSPVIPLQIIAYNLLKKQLPRVVAQDTITVGTQGVEPSASDTAKCHGLEVQPLLTALLQTQAVVEAMLAEFQFGDSCSVQPHTDSYAYTTAFLLLWDVLLEMCGMAGSELRYQYAAVLRDAGCLSSLLQTVFHLVPAEVVEGSAHKGKSAVVRNMFSAAPHMCFSSPCTSEQLQHWACWVYYNTLRRLPAMVRRWWGDTKPRVNSLVQRATLEYVTPLLCSRELQSIQSHDTRFKNMEVKVHARVREVVAVYAVDEAHMELVITLPEVYPLGVVQVGSHATIAPTNQWRAWVKQLSIFLTHQNGSLWDGLLLWKSNLDKRFEGVEECYICFSILHGTNFQIPKLCCKTCKKKFHSPCLYKWFSTSNKSTCPICRNMF